MEKNRKPKYTIFQNTIYILKLSLEKYKFLSISMLSIAICMSLTTVIEIFMLPEVIKKVENNLPVSEVLKTIFFYIGALIIISAIKEYLDINRFFPGVDFRTEVLQLINSKFCNTSYENILDTRFNEAEENASESCSSNNAAAEAIWKTMTDLIFNIISLIVFIMIIKNLSITLSLVVIITTFIGYLLNKKISLWEYENREESSKFLKKLNYLQKVASSREYAKEVKIFSLSTWIKDLWSSTYNLYKAFRLKREKKYLLINLSDVILSFLRNAIAYFYLINYTITKGLPASYFLYILLPLVAFQI